ncbi:DUF3135 domain-containing protein [Vibrio sp. IRLE0018]|uniref:DUF3135 domain-containing protein n=1 Tax=Vibrio TaxID=662 RepID=UPI001594711E|nr:MULTISPECIES: DUF3135 domain-containing protein [Vibrio]MCF8781075.1 DUF3135 domain-containing protein [Vibrio floridensis]NVC64087.1 DUF3135 domain-containing protein [Vibrio sp. 05-20-BW147]HAS6349611.1 DUF3135 domain-containing protein [Vibrio vulnificus]
MGSLQTEQQLPSFDEMMALAAENPNAFNQFKQEMCHEMIQSASEAMRERLVAQQSHIDLVISRCKNPVHTNVVLMNELTKQMVKFREALDSDGSDTLNQDAQIIPFTPKTFY